MEITGKEKQVRPVFHREGDMPQTQKDYYNAMKRRYALPLPEQEKRQQSALVTALMGDGKVDEVMACMKKK